MHTLFLLTLSLFFLSACGNQDAALDNWSGTGPLDFSKEASDSLALSDTDSFNFDSTLRLPTRQSGDSYKLTTTCVRSLKEDSDKKRFYKKTISSESIPKEQTDVSTVDILPGEVLIFPKCFTSCDFKIDYTTKIGSTDSSSLSGQKIDLKKYQREINVQAPKDILVSEKHISSLKIKAETSELSKTKLFCFAKKISESSIDNNGLSSFTGELFKLPPQTKDVPVEYCIIAGKDFYGKTIISNRFKIFNRRSYDRVHIEHASLRNPSVQVPYSNTPPQTFTALHLKLENRSADTQHFKFKSGKSLDNIYINTSLKFIKNSSTKEAYSLKKFHMNLKPVKSEYFWSPSQKNNTADFTLNPGEAKILKLVVKSSFKCRPKRKNYFKEIGFIVAIGKQNPLLKIEHLNTNDFIHDSHSSGNVFTLYPHLRFKNNLPKGHSRQVVDRTDFQIFLRNKGSYGGKDLKLTHTTSWSTFHFLRKQQNSLATQAQYARYRSTYFFEQPESFCSKH